jgi:hypothetical protein
MNIMTHNFKSTLLSLLSAFLIVFNYGVMGVLATEAAAPGGGCTLSTGLQIPKPCTTGGGDQYNFVCTGLSQKDCLKYNPMIQWIRFFINLISALVGVIVVIMVTLAGIQYSAAADNPQGVQAAKKRIENVLIGLVAYIFLYAFLQWLIPGGLV